MDEHTPKNNVYNDTNNDFANFESTTLDKIVYTLQDKSEGLTEFGIAKETGLDRDTVRRKLRKLTKEEKVAGCKLVKRKRIRYFTPKNLILYIISNSTELYPNQHKITKQLFIKSVKDKSNDELKAILDKIGSKYGSINSLDFRKAKQVINEIIDILSQN